MGRHRHNRRKQHSGQDRGNWEDGNKGSNERNYKTADKQNALFEKYYKAQDLMPTEEWDSFLETLREQLPVTFRITGNRKQARELLRVIQSHYLSRLVDAQVDGQAIDPPKCLEWYPDGLAWQLNIGRKALRSNDILKRLHEFLVAETESGNISRQEAVSMIPPVLLDIKPNHKILDLCAAPGSKTAQLIEYLHAEEEDAHSMPEGFVVANDVDNKRCYLMVHQVKRIQSPNCLIINHDATYFPNIRSGKDQSGRDQFILYDRILVDVPCSGDGTMRKNPDVWTRWNPAMGYNMHHLQMKILRRALELLAVGGRLVYSTCSLNPIEDEAVVASMLQKCEGAVEIVNVEDQLPGLKKVKGLTTWKCMSKAGDWYENFEEVPERLHSQVKPSMFPPTPEVAQQLRLDRCVRVLPHHQNSGGFFIVALQKMRHLPWTREARLADKAKNGPEAPVQKAEAPVQDNTEVPSVPDSQPGAKDGLEASKTTEESGDLAETGTGEKAEPDQTAKPDAGGESVAMETDQSEGTESRGEKRPNKGPNPPAKQPRMRGYKEDPFLFLSPNDPVWPQIRDFYKLPADFPVECVLYRSQESSKRSLYYVCQAVRDIVNNNRDKLRFINTGVKILGRGTSPLVPHCDYRITNEGIATVSLLFPHRHVAVTREDAVCILSEENPYLDKLSESTQQTLADIEPGSIVLNYVPREEDPSPKCEITFCGWRGKNSVRSFVAKDGRFHNLLLLGVDIEELRAKVAAKKQEKEALKSGKQDGATKEEEDADGQDKSGGNEEGPSSMEDEDGKSGTGDVADGAGDVKDSAGDLTDGAGGASQGRDKGEAVPKDKEVESKPVDKPLEELKSSDPQLSRTPEQNSPMDLSVKTT